MSNDSAVVITGAASGIGRAVVLACAGRGWQVAALDLDAGKAAEVADEARGSGAPDAMGIGCDVAREDEVAEAVAACVDRLGVPSGLFANAGIEINGPMHDLPLADWDRVLQINLTGVFLSCRHTIRAMLAGGRGGSIVCTSSPAAFVGFAGGGNGAYAASKGGITALVRSLALDYATDGIRVNAVVPGATDTPMLLTGVPADQHTESHARLLEQAKVQIPLGRLAEPREVAAAVTWLLSSDASYVTGSHLVCDGGLMAKSVNTI
jgi:NAD(P)-dependent dehydrogenase (short-subunit alcohol dehydrogenase family)